MHFFLSLSLSRHLASSIGDGDGVGADEAAIEERRQSAVTQIS